MAIPRNVNILYRGQGMKDKTKVYFAAVQGKGIISSLIRWWQWGDPHTHVAYVKVLPTGYQVLEAYFTPLLKGGLVTSYPVSEPYYLKKEVITYYTLEVTNAQKIQIEFFLDSLMGKKYDLMGILGFFTRNPRTNSARRWFCSEALIAAVNSCGIELFLNTTPQEVSPAMFIKSPLLQRHEFTK
jgi:hypothetical protein